MMIVMVWLLWCFRAQAAALCNKDFASILCFFNYSVYSFGCSYKLQLQLQPLRAGLADPQPHFVPLRHWLRTQLMLTSRASGRPPPARRRC